MRKRGRVRTRYGSFALLEFLLGMVVPDAASGASCQISGATTATAGQAYAYTATCTPGVVGYAWASSLASCGTSGQTVVCAFGSPGAATVRVTATYGGSLGSAAAVLPVTVLTNTPPVGSCTVSANPPGPLTAGGSSTLFASCTGTPSQIHWASSLANCSPSSGTSTTCTFPTAGNAIVSAQATYGSSFASASYTMQVTAPPIGTCHISASPPSPVTAGAASSFSAGCTGSPSLVQWTSCLGSCSPSTGPSTTCKFPTPGSASVRVQASYGGCLASDTYAMQVAAAPPLCSITANPAGPVAPKTPVKLAASCSNGPTSYRWSTNQTTPTITVAPDHTTAYTVTAMNAAGPSSPRTATITVVAALPPPTCFPPGQDPPNPVPPGIPVTLRANCSGATSYRWSTGATSPSIAVKPLQSTTYTVTASNSGGGSTPAAAAVVVNVPPPAAPPECTIATTAPNGVATGAAVMLSATCSDNPTAYQWSANGVPFASTDAVIVTPSKTTAYVLAATNSLGTKERSVDVPVPPPPPRCAIKQDPPGAVTPGAAVTLTGTCDNDPVELTWTLGAGGGAVVAQGQTNAFAPTQTGTYFLTAKGPGGVSIPAQVTVVVNSAPTDCTIAALPPALPPGGGSVQLTATCRGGLAPTSYAWEGPGVQGQSGAVVNPGISGTTTFAMTASNAGGTSSRSEITVAVGVDPPSCTVTPAPAQLPAGGGTVQLTASCTGIDVSPTGYAWSGLPAYPPGTKGPTSAAVSAFVTSTTTFAVTASNPGGTSPPSSATVTVPTGPPDNYQGLWWNAAESGWGINLVHQADTIFASWFTYDVDGTALWMVVALNRDPARPNVYAGDVFRPIDGPPFWMVRFDASAVHAAKVGTATITFADAKHATFDFEVNGAKGSRAITPQEFSAPVPACAWGPQPNLEAATNYQDLWWADPDGSESGWGINITHQGSVVYATWFTYDGVGKPLWMTVAAPRIAPTIYEGTVYMGNGPAYNAPFDPSKLVATPLGKANLTFDDGTHGTFTYDIVGVFGRKRIKREPIAGVAGSATVCAPTEAVTACQVVMTKGFAGDPNGNYIDNGSGSGGGGGGGGDGGGAGAGAGEGKVLGGVMTVTRLSDGAALGSAVTDPVEGLVTIRSCDADLPVLLTLAGQPEAQYFDEGTNSRVPFGSGKVLHALVDQFDSNIGVSALTEAAYRYALNTLAADGKAVALGKARLKAAGPLTLTLGQVRQANAVVENEINRMLTTDMQLTGIKSLPTPVDGSSPQNAYPVNRYGLSALLTGAFAKSTVNYLPASATPGLDMTEQFARDLTDGKLNGFALDGTAAAPDVSRSAYDPVRLPVALNTAMYALAQRFGKDTAFRLGTGVSDLAKLDRDGEAEGFACPGYIQRDRAALLRDGTVSVLRTLPVPGQPCFGDVSTDDDSYVYADATTAPAAPFATDVKQLLGAHRNVFVVKNDGTVWAWGDRSCGLIGDGQTAGWADAPVQVQGLTNVTSIASNGSTVIARDGAGDVYSWGADDSGLLGTGGVADASDCNGQAGAFNFVPRKIPTLANIVSVALPPGTRKAFAIDTSGNVYAWGEQTVASANSVPIQVQGLSLVIAVDDAGTDYVYVLQSDGTVWWMNLATGDSAPIAGLADVVELVDHVALLRDGSFRYIVGFDSVTVDTPLPRLRHIGQPGGLRGPYGYAVDNRVFRFSDRGDGEPIVPVSLSGF